MGVTHRRHLGAGRPLALQAAPLPQLLLGPRAPGPAGGAVPHLAPWGQGRGEGSWLLLGRNQKGLCPTVVLKPQCAWHPPQASSGT